MTDFTDPTMCYSPSDAYHSCYVLSGLSSAQHKWELVENQEIAASAAAADADADEGANLAAGSLGSWSVSPYLDEVQVFNEQDRIVPLHPVYAIPAECVADIKTYFDTKQGF